MLLGWVPKSAQDLACLGGEHQGLLRGRAEVHVVQRGRLHLLPLQLSRHLGADQCSAGQRHPEEPLHGSWLAVKECNL